MDMITLERFLCRSKNVLATVITVVIQDRMAKHCLLNRTRLMSILGKVIVMMVLMTMTMSMMMVQANTERTSRFQVSLSLSLFFSFQVVSWIFLFGSRSFFCTDISFFLKRSPSCSSGTPSLSHPLNYMYLLTLTLAWNISTATTTTAACSCLTLWNHHPSSGPSGIPSSYSRSRSTSSTSNLGILHINIISHLLEIILLLLLLLLA